MEYDIIRSVNNLLAKKNPPFRDEYYSFCKVDCPYEYAQNAKEEEIILID